VSGFDPSQAAGHFEAAKNNPIKLFSALFGLLYANFERGKNHETEKKKNNTCLFLQIMNF
jgi:hypothetical protein